MGYHMPRHTTVTVFINTELSSIQEGLEFRISFNSNQGVPVSVETKGKD